MMFVRVDMFRRMEMAPLPGWRFPDTFMGFDTNVQFFRELSSPEAGTYRDASIARAVALRLQDWGEDDTLRYTPVLPVCIVTEGVTCVNCYREDSKTLYAYDPLHGKLLFKSLEPGNVDLEFWQGIKFDNDNKENKEKQE